MDVEATLVQSLDSHQPFLITANIRGSIDIPQYRISSGLGQVGDLMFGHIEKQEAKEAKSETAPAE